jgi:hypothetical protein
MPAVFNRCHAMAHRAFDATARGTTRRSALRHRTLDVCGGVPQWDAYLGKSRAFESIAQRSTTRMRWPAREMRIQI